MSKIKNTSKDLNNLLFEQLERLADADEESLKSEIAKAKAMSGVAEQIISNASLALEAEKLKVEYRTDGETTPKFSGFLGG